MNILMLLQKPFPPDIRVTKEATSLLAAGYQVHLLCRSEQGQLAEEEVDGIKVHRLQMRRIRGMAHQSLHFLALFIEPAFLRQIVALHVRYHFGAIHVHDLPLARTAIVAGRRLSIPVVFDMHENWPELVRLVKAAGSGPRLVRAARMLKNAVVYNGARYLRLERWCLERADHLIVVAEEQRRRLLRNGLTDDRISVVMNVADIDRVRRAESCDSPRIQSIETDCMMVFLGVFSPHRGLDVAIRALALVRQEISNAHLVLVGKGDIRSDLTRLAEESGLRDAVTFTGWVDLPEALAVVRAGDICLIPHRRSPHIDTTIPHKLFQYMLLEKPVVVTDAPPLRRIVEGVGCGLVCRSGDPESMARAVLNIARSGNAGAMGARGREAVYARYNWAKEARKLVDVHSGLRQKVYRERGRGPRACQHRVIEDGRPVTKQGSGDQRLRRVLVVTYIFPPAGGGGVPRISKYVKFLPRLGWQPIILTVDEKVYRSVGRPIDHSLMEDVPSEAIVERTRFWDLGGISRGLQETGKEASRGSRPLPARIVRRVGSSTKRALRGVGDILIQPDAQLLWIPVAVARGLRLTRRHNVEAIITYSNPYSVHVVGAILRVLTGLPWVADYADPWTVRPYGRYAGRLRIRLWIQRQLERLVVRLASKVSLATDMMEEEYRDVFGNGRRVAQSAYGDKFETIRNGFDPEDFAGLGPLPKDKFVITYAGSIYRFYPLDHFLQALSNWLRNDVVARECTQFSLVGRIDSWTKKRVHELGLDSVVQIHGYVPRVECLRHMMSADVLLLVIDDMPTTRSLLTGKIFEYLGARRPILGLVPREGMAAELIESEGVGRVVSPRDVSSIEHELRFYYGEYSAGHISRTSTRSPRSVFTRMESARRLSLLLETAIAEHHACAAEGVDYGSR